MKYDIIVVGGGHAGCEASLASSRLNKKTLLITGNKENIPAYLNAFVTSVYGNK